MISQHFISQSIFWRYLIPVFLRGFTSIPGKDSDSLDVESPATLAMKLASSSSQPLSSQSLERNTQKLSPLLIQCARNSKSESCPTEQLHTDF